MRRRRRSSMSRTLCIPISSSRNKITRHTGVWCPSWPRAPICVRWCRSYGKLWRRRALVGQKWMEWRRRGGRAWSGPLIVGLSLAKGLALARNKPLIGVHHLEAHVFSNLVAAQVEVPFLTLLVSGGHTELILVRELGSVRGAGPHAATTRPARHLTRSPSC